MRTRYMFMLIGEVRSDDALVNTMGSCKKWFWDEMLTWKQTKSTILLWYLYLPNTNTHLIPAL